MTNFKLGETYLRCDGVAVTIITTFEGFTYGTVVKGDDGLSRWDVTGEVSYGQTNPHNLILFSQQGATQPPKKQGALKIK